MGITLIVCPYSSIVIGARLDDMRCRHISAVENGGLIMEPQPENRTIHFVIMSS
jgi:hypothetical protein